MTENVGPDDVIDKISRSGKKKFAGWDREGKGWFSLQSFNYFSRTVSAQRTHLLREVVQILFVWQETKTSSSSDTILPKDHGQAIKC